MSLSTKVLLPLVLLLLACTTIDVQAQSRVRHNDVYGKWKLVINIDEEGDSALERVVLNAVDGLLDEIDVTFDFRDEYQVKVITHAFDDTEVEYTEWHITDRGELVIGETEHVDLHSDTVWMMQGNRLQAYEYENGRRSKEEHYLQRQ